MENVGYCRNDGFANDEGRKIFKGGVVVGARAAYAKKMAHKGGGAFPRGAIGSKGRTKRSSDREVDECRRYCSTFSLTFGLKCRLLNVTHTRTRGGEGPNPPGSGA